MRSSEELAGGHLVIQSPIDRVFAGQTDLADRSHFTIEYETGGVRTTVDGWLRGDESVLLKARPTSAATHSAALIPPVPASPAGPR